MKSLYKNSIWLFALVFTFLASCEQDKIDLVEYGSLKGNVFDLETYQPISNVLVSTSPASSSVLTDENGDFLIDKIKAGEVTVTAKKNDYVTSSITVEVISGEDSEISVGIEYDNQVSAIVELSDPNPYNGANNQFTNVTLSWDVYSRNVRDSITYNLKLFTNGFTDPVIEEYGLTDTACVLSGLEYSSTFFWQVSAFVDDEELHKSEIWSFKTEEFPNMPYMYSKYDDGVYKIYATDADKTREIKVSGGDNQLSEWNPVQSPYSGEILFVSNINQQPKLHLMEKDGSYSRMVTDVPNTGFNNWGEGVCWLDRNQVIFSSFNKLYRIRTDGTVLMKIAEAPMNHHFKACDYNPITKKIIAQVMGEYPFQSSFILMNLDGSEEETLIHDGAGGMESPSFSIDGKKVMFVQDVSGYESADGRMLNAHIFLMDLATQEKTDLTVNKADGTNDLMPRFSPDGSKIIFINAENTEGKVGTLMTMDLDGSDREEVLTGASYPCWNK